MSASSPAGAPALLRRQRGAPTWGKGAQLPFIRRASGKERGRDGTAYSDYHASGGFLSHHLARISMAAVYWDAQHIDRASASSSSARSHTRKCAAATTR